MFRTQYVPKTPVPSHHPSRIEVPSPDGSWLAVGGFPDHTVALFKADEDRWRLWVTYSQHREGVSNRQGIIQALAWSPAGTYIASGSSTGSLHVWDTRGRWYRRPRQVGEGEICTIIWQGSSLEVALLKKGQLCSTHIPLFQSLDVLRSETLTPV